MHELPILDDLDRQLVGALQISPRASWAQLAPVLSSTPSTLSRRWDALVGAGLAWTTVTALPASPALGPQLAFVEAACESGRREESIAALADMPEVMSIESCAGEHDLMLTVATTNIRAVDRLVNERIVVAPGVARTRTHYANGIVVEGSSFRLGSLTPAQRRAIAARRPARTATPSAGPTPAQARIAAELVGDARRSASEVARRTGLSASHVQRQLAQMEGEPWFLCRADISAFDFGLIAVYLWVRCPVDLIDEVVQFARQSPGVRMLVPIVSRTNLLFSVWLPGLDRISEFERRLAHAFPSAEIADRWLQTSKRKRIGVLLDEEGRALVPPAGS